MKWIKKYVLFGCGGDRDKAKEKWQYIVDQFSSKIIITEDNSRTKFKKIVNDILKGIKKPDKVKIISQEKSH